MSDTPSFATCDLCDAHKGDDSGAFRVLPPVFREFGAKPRFAGPVVTVKCFEDNTPVKRALEGPGEGRVLVVDGGGSLRRALVGGNIGAAAARNGWAGVVIDGCVRDVAELAGSEVGICALAPNYATLLPLRVLAVIAPAVFTPQAAASVGLLVSPAQRGRAITFVFLGWSVASVMGMPLSAWIGGELGWRWAFGLVALLSMASGLWVWRAMPDGIRPAALSRQAWGQTLGSAPLMLAVGVTLLSAFGQFTLFSYFAPYFFQTLGLGGGALSLMFLWFGTDHLFTANNWNLALLTPLGFAVVPTVWRRGRRASFVAGDRQRTLCALCGDSPPAGVIDAGQRDPGPACRTAAMLGFTPFTPTYEVRAIKTLAQPLNTPPPAHPCGSRWRRNTRRSRGRA